MKTRTAGVLLFPGFEPLDAFGPMEALVISEWPPGAPGEAPPFRVVTLAQGTAPLAMRGGARVVPDHALASSPPLDLLLVPGGPGTRTEHKNPALLGFIAERARTAEVVCSVCTGAALLACAGVLSGLPATTNRRAFDWVVSVSPPDIHWDRTRRWVDAGVVVTSAGVSAGTDMALHLVERFLGGEAARAAASRMEYHWEPDGADPH
ncbi:MAG TPA: DJ-1/PfpI family protein [Anaeromyxobacteraceae bacterium]|nr:DJ-1/PfpI family protein [Anaeromyxobacteraceae bacterium]